MRKATRGRVSTQRIARRQAAVTGTSRAGTHQGLPAKCGPRTRLPYRTATAVPGLHALAASEQPQFPAISNPNRAPIASSQAVMGASTSFSATWWSCEGSLLAGPDRWRGDSAVHVLRRTYSLLVVGNRREPI
jgi:hypothetical protein